MKNFKVLILGIVCSLISFGCYETSEITPQITNQTIELSSIKNYEGNLNRPGFFKRAWSWVKSHVGTYLFENCKGKNPCGPCSGICLSRRHSNILTLEGELIESTSLEVSPEEYEKGIRPFEIAIVENIETGEQFVQFEFRAEDIGDIAYNESFIVSEDTSVSDEICTWLGIEELGINNIMMKQGYYPLDFDPDANRYYVVVDFY